MMRPLGANSRTRRGGRLSMFETRKAIEYGERLVGRRPADERRLEQPPCFSAVAALECRDATVQQFFGLALAFGERAPGPLDVGVSARMAAVQKQRARPDVDRVLVLRGKVMI